jgi:hypothetical protein
MRDQVDRGRSNIPIVVHGDRVSARRELLDAHLVRLARPHGRQFQRVARSDHPRGEGVDPTRRFIDHRRSVLHGQGFNVPTFLDGDLAGADVFQSECEWDALAADLAESYSVVADRFGSDTALAESG